MESKAWKDNNTLLKLKESENPSVRKQNQEEMTDLFDKLYKTYGEDRVNKIAIDIDEEYHELDPKKRYKLIVSKLKEAKNEVRNHRYTFLFSDGNGAASRGGEVDNYFNIVVNAPDLNTAAVKAWVEFNNCNSFEEWAEDYGCSPEEAQEIKSDIISYIDDLDITGGEPWIEGIKEDEEIIREPDVENMRYYGYDFNDWDDAEVWGINSDSDEDEDDNPYSPKKGLFRFVYGGSNGEVRFTKSYKKIGDDKTMEKSYIPLVDGYLQGWAWYRKNGVYSDVDGHIVYSTLEEAEQALEKRIEFIRPNGLKNEEGRIYKVDKKGNLTLVKTYK